MKFSIRNEIEILELEVDPQLLGEAEEFFQKMDADMDQGCRMGPIFVAEPDPVERAQMAAQKIMMAMEEDNQMLLQMMVGYILARHPNCQGVVLNDTGDPKNHQLLMTESSTL